MTFKDGFSPMSLEDVRSQNIQLVTEKALDCFIKNGIANTKVSDIARVAGLTERSVYRYFATKNDLVIAAAFCYWERVKEYAAWKLSSHDYAHMSGIEQISVILNSYASILLIDPEGIRFTLDAEVALFNSGENEKVVNRPPERFEEYTGPLSQAIVLGLSDGTVDPNADIKQLYYNSYDSILGLMQRLTVGVPSVNELDIAERLQAMCRMFTREFAAKS